MSEEKAVTSFFEDTKSEAQILLETVGQRMKTSMDRAFLALDNAVSEAEALLADGGTGKHGAHQVVVADAAALKAAFGEQATAELETFAKLGRALLDTCKRAKNARPTNPGVTVREASPELLKALRQPAPLPNDPAALVQPTELRMGNEAPLLGVVAKGKGKPKGDELVKP